MKLKSCLFLLWSFFKGNISWTTSLRRWIAITIDLKYRNMHGVNYFVWTNAALYLYWDIRYNTHFCTLALARHIFVITRCKSTKILLAMRFKRYRLLLEILWCLKILWLGVIHLKDLMTSLFKHLSKHL